MRSIIIACDSGVIKYQKEVWGEGEGGVAEGGDREMGKWRTGMNEVPDYMDACVRVWGEREKGELATKLYISSLCIGF